MTNKRGARWDKNLDERARFGQLTALFETIAALDPEAQPSAIERGCGADAALAAEVRRMLAHDVGSEQHEDPVWALIRPAADALANAPMLGQTVGSWRILSVLGEGGMGTVYLAERADGEFESKVAIKLAHHGLASAGRDRRFRAERQILARLSHPGIARLLDGGTMGDGTPFLVMELVDGVAITTWCDSQALDLRARLELFLRVCDAVASAHQGLIAHLDLKPSNILVDEAGAVKLLDFGVAKLLGADQPDAVPGTTTLMTPAYASPEQLRGEPTEVASDVYSLGVILFELLTRGLPLDSDDGTLAGWVRTVSKQEPAMPSSLAADGDRRRLRGDLDAIIGKTLRKAPQLRYGSVQSMADDLRRWLDGYPVAARGGRASYRALRFVQRNLVPVVAAVALVGGSLGFARYAVVQAHAIEAERDHAERERATAQRVSLFLQQLLTEADPNEGSGPDVTIRQVLDRGARTLAEQLQDEPEIHATLALVVGQVYRSWGEL
ncbi:MAG: serine/threonine protein kinase, partial [Nannocystaceae bacterium]|nr:serine/threonine protein kinase [Nannocystaceae bacterium]